MEKNKIEQRKTTSFTNAPKEQADVCVIGAGITGLTTAFYLTKYGKRVCVIETADRIGGQICTHKVDGFIIESGPNTGSIACPEVVELFQDLGKSSLLQTACSASKHRWIWKGNKFYNLPEGLFSALSTPLFTWYDKFRILGEPFRKKGTNADETVGALVVRRLGKSYLKYAVDPFISGVYAGDPMKLVTRYALPKLYQLEYNYGSFICGAIAKAKQSKTDRDKLATKEVFSAHGGLEQLVKALGDKIGVENIVLGAHETEIHPYENGYQVSYKNKDNESCTIDCKKVITTCGAYALPKLLPFVSKELMNNISSLFYAPIVQVGVGIKDTKGVDFKAFGGLVPSCEHKDVLGILLPSACFTGRSPQKGITLSFFIGGVRHQDFINKTDEELMHIVDEALHHMLKLPASVKPDVIRIFRHQCAIPQYEITSGARFSAIEKVQQQYSGLILAGNLRDGIGMAHRIKQAVDVAKSLSC